MNSYIEASRLYGLHVRLGLGLICLAAFDGFGEVPFELYEPLLHECCPKTLIRLEKNTPVMT